MPLSSSSSTRGITSAHFLGNRSRQRSGGSLTWLSVSMTGIRSAIAVICPLSRSGPPPSRAAEDYLPGQKRMGEAAVERVSEAEQLAVDAVVVGAGVAGLYAVHRLTGLGLPVVGLEAGDGVGGTWYWNRYPGCRCDVPTIEYSYSFDEDLENEWSFPETMSAQPDIERYLNHVADRFDLRRHFRFGTRVVAATFDEQSDRWIVETDRGARYTASWCVMATGSLSAYA